MRILLLTQDITVSEVPRGYNTGFSLMVAQIAAALSREGAEVCVSSSSLTNDTLTIHPSGGNHPYTLLGRTPWQLLRHLRWSDLPRALCHAFAPRRMSMARRMKRMKYTLSIGFIAHLIRQTRPDAIFIHSIGPETLPFISAALRMGIPPVITLHGLFHQPGSSSRDTLAEERILPFLIKHGVTLTVVGSGMRRKLLEASALPMCPCLHVVPNAVDEEEAVPDISTADPWNKKYRLIAIGNLSERKNQSQLLRAFALLPASLRADSQLCLIGKDSLNGRLQQEASTLGIADACIFTGSLPHAEVFRWIRHANVVVLASRNEGFGLSIIEGYREGVPAVCFDHLDAFDDFYHERCMIAVHEESDAALSHAISEALTKEWDKDSIRTFARKFDNHTMATSYLHILQNVPRPNLTEKEFNRQADRYLTE